MPDEEVEMEFDLSSLDGMFQAVMDANEEPDEDELELVVEGYDVVRVGNFGMTTDYTRAFLIDTREEFTKEGMAIYTCCLEWTHNRVNDADVERHMSAFRTQISRLRLENPQARHFRTALVEYKILPDNRRVILTVARLTEEHYQTFAAEKRAAAAKPSAVRGLGDLL